MGISTPVRLRQLPGGGGGVVALHHGADLLHGLLDGHALADEDACTGGFGSAWRCR